MSLLTTKALNKLTAKDPLSKFYAAAWEDIFACMEKPEQEKLTFDLKHPLDPVRGDHREHLSVQKFVRQVAGLAEELYDKRQAAAKAQTETAKPK